MCNYEEWRTVEEVPIYEVSNLGNVRHKITKNILTAKVVCRSYLQVKLWNIDHHSTRQNHILVAKAFIGKLPNGYETHHKDGNKINNIAGNLEYTTNAGNAIETFRSGGLKRSNAVYRLNEESVKVIKWFLKNRKDITVAKLARVHKVTVSTINNIKFRRSWLWISV